MVLRHGGRDVAGGGGGEGGVVGSSSMRGELLVGRYQRVLECRFRLQLISSASGTLYPNRSHRGHAAQILL